MIRRRELLRTSGAPSRVSLMRRPPFVRFWLARGLAVPGNQTLTVALGWQVYDLTRGPLALGLIGRLNTLLLTGACSRLFPALWQVDRLDEPE